MVVVIVAAEIVDELLVGVAERRGAALGDRVDRLLRQPGLARKPDMCRPFELRGPITRGHQDCDFGLARRELRAEANMRPELVGVIGKAGALEPDMHRRRHRAARAGLAVVEDAALRVVHFGLGEFPIARHCLLLRLAFRVRHHTVIEPCS